jgi:2',3'-cyclic-nucleotide 2'-phosphodiesterase (5'-nucleotidase family)
VEGDRELARTVDGVDVIVGGHSHTRITTPEVVNGVVIVQAGAHNRNLGKLVLQVENDSVVAHEGGLIELWPREGGRDDLREMVGEWEVRIEKEFGRVIGRLVTAWDRSYHGESNIGNWLCDRLREHTETDFAVLNSGGIRKNLGSGPVTKLDIMEVLPFANLVTTFTCTGEELLSIMETNARAAAFESHGILQVSGIRYGYRRTGDTVELLDPTVGGRPVDPEATYRGATVDYVAVGNGERYFGFVPDDPESSGVKIADVILDAVEAAPAAIDARVDGRMTAVASGRKAG